jgi:hypothetical protein
MLKFSGYSYLTWDLRRTLTGPDLSLVSPIVSPSRFNALVHHRFSAKSTWDDWLIKPRHSWLPIRLQISSPEPLTALEKSSYWFCILTQEPTLRRYTDTHTSMLPGKSRMPNVRSKSLWFTRSCNSHHVSHFAAFFIVVGTKTSVAESCIYKQGQRKQEIALCCIWPFLSRYLLTNFVYVKKGGVVVSDDSRAFFNFLCLVDTGHRTIAHGTMLKYPITGPFTIG